MSPKENSQDDLQLLTTGRVAAILGVSLHRVVHVLRTRGHIRPVARAGTLRLYRRTDLPLIRHELHAIDARRCRRQQVYSAT